MLRVLVLSLLAVGCECRDRLPPIAAEHDDELGARIAEALAAKGSGYQPHAKHRRADGTPRYTNRLILEHSPYLIQHAHNPVDWYAWGDEAFAKAAREDKLVFLSIGYSTCHWCHVMAEESFEDVGIAAALAKHFVAIKVDREERPDLDAIYMAAVQRMTGNGGWPLTVILLPDRRPVFGGTYFPPADNTHGAGLRTVLDRVRREPREGLARRANVLVAELQKMVPVGGDLPGAGAIDAAAASYAKGFDSAWGGFGRAPKFPQPTVLALLLRAHRRSGDAATLAMVERTLEKLAAGGIHDQIGRGFHRYSVDDKWRVPHFEKMLYDNAQLASVYLEAYQVTKREDFATVARHTLSFLEMELTEGACFAAAIDADSAGKEGTHYVWRTDEIDKLFDERTARIIREYYDMTIGGNFEHGTNVLWRPASSDEVARKLGVERAVVDDAIFQAQVRLYAMRTARAYPHVDRKVLVAWNSLAISAFARAALVLREPDYLARARSCASAVLARRGDRLGHSILDGKATGEAFLDDHAYLIAGLLDLFEVDPDPRWLREAIALQKALDDRFADPAGGYFFTASDHESLLVRDKPDHDDVLPAGNSVAALNLLRLHQLTGEARYRTAAEATFRAFGTTLARAPTAMPAMLTALDFYLDRPKQIVLVAPKDGGNTNAFVAKLATTFVPNRIVLRVTDGDPPITPLVEGKTAQRFPTAYVCIGTQCERPTTDPDTFAEQLR